MACHIICFVLFFFSFRFVSFRFHLFRFDFFVSFRFDLFRFCFVSHFTVTLEFEWLLPHATIFQDSTCGGEIIDSLQNSSF